MRIVRLLVLLACCGVFGAAVPRLVPVDLGPSINLDLTKTLAAMPVIDEGSRRRAFAAGDWHPVESIQP